jgi:hypothetical protein
MGLLEGDELDCVVMEGKEIYYWRVPLFRRVCKEVELGEEVEWLALSSSVCPQP